MIWLSYISIFHFTGTIDDSERLRPEELNQQNIEALVAESNLVHPQPSILMIVLLASAPVELSPKNDIDLIE